MRDWDSDAELPGDRYDEVSSDDHDDDEETVTRDCPACGAAVYEDAEQCPRCGEWITAERTGSLWSERPIWWIAVGLLGVLALILALLGLV